MAERALIGVLTPSSNTVLEPVTSAMLAGLPKASAHFSRFPVTSIALSAESLAQFDAGPMLAAARLLADARVGVIAWSGTSSSWLGFDKDEALCGLITSETGIAACTSVLALNELMMLRHPGRRIGLVTPYTSDVQAEIVANYARSGYSVVSEAHFGLSENFAFSELADAQIAARCREVARSKPDAVIIMCTNMSGAVLADRLEAELGVPVYDSAAAIVWKSLQILGVAPGRVKDWGSMFA